MSKPHEDAPLNGDMTRRVVVDTTEMDWSPSPSGTVWRKRLHRVGPAESGQVTSFVRYQVASEFPTHDHPEGEEILVLSGTFSDEHGDWPAGSYLLNPEGFRHSPFSREGCTLFVKLRQYPGLDREHHVIDTTRGAWEPGDAPGVERLPLYRQAGFPDTMRLERWSPGAEAPESEWKRPGGAELFVLEGALEDEHGRYGTHTWLRLPEGASHRPRSSEGALVYVKQGGLALCRSEPDPAA